jgi:divalent metal cation (Fe/Co/Zn/Cd) transporter
VRAGVLAISLIAADVAIKLCLYLYCIRIAKRSAIAAALAQDHRNDVVVNSVALASSILGPAAPR